MSALAAGLWLSIVAMPSRTLRGLAASRRVLAPLAAGSDSGADLELHAGQPVSLELTFQNTARWPALLLRGLEPCALAPLPDRKQSLYIPAIAFAGAKGDAVAEAVKRINGVPTDAHNASTSF